MNDMEDKQLPQDKEAEKTVLATIMADKNALPEVRQMLDVEAFYCETHREIYKAQLAISERGDFPDLIAVMNELNRRKSGVTPYELTELSGHVTNFLAQHAAEVFDKYKRRQFFEIGCYLQSNCFSEENDIVDVVEEARKRMEGIFPDDGRSVSTIRDAVQGVYDNINRNMTGGEGLTGSPTGFGELDRRSGGLQTSDLVIIAADTSMGKALPMDANILTPSGWVKNKDLKLGQQICSPNGEESFVTGIFYRGIRPMYRVSFSDGRSVICCNEHLWEITSCAFKTGNRVMTTEKLKDMQDNTVAYHNKMATPEFSGIWGERKKFVIHPYLMGVLLGDGSLSRGVEWNKPDRFLVDKIRGMIRSEYAIHKVGRSEIYSPSYRITQGKGQKNIYLEELKRLGLHGKRSAGKFIPDEYLNASREQRIQLMQGLMDTDGYIGKNGECVFSSKSEALSDGVMYLAHSLGYKASKRKKKAKLYGKDFGFSYTICINDKNRDELFSLPRKKNRVIHHKRISNVVRSVEYVGEMECQCISVSHPSELYVTDGFIVTHNTSLAIKMAMNAGCPVAFYSMEMKKEQIAARMISIETGVAANEILYSRLGASQITAIDKGVSQICEKPVFFDDRSTSSIETILASIRMMKIKYGIKGAVVDYLQILNVNMKGANKEQQMGDVARRLKNIAKDLDIWVIALSQINRDRDNPAPSLSRLRDSGQIAEAADTVILIYRPEVYGRSYPDPFTNASTKDTAMIEVAKGRNIGLLKFIVGFNKPTTNFYELGTVPQAEFKQKEEDPF